MATATQHGPGSGGFLRTERTDNWWTSPMLVFIGLSLFVVYATYRIVETGLAANAGADLFLVADNAAFGYHYISPFGSPNLTGIVEALFGATAAAGVPFALANPAFLILPFPAGFRFTCYYYRKAYYRAFVGRPASCAVGALAPGKYEGEKKWLIFQNLHRYFLYPALAIVAFLAYDFAVSVYTPHGWYFGIGSVILGLNAFFLAAYTFGCHSLRHLVGGKLDCYSCDAVSHTRHSLWSKVTMLNQRHMLWAWVSLIWVALTDVYVRYVAANNIDTILGLPA